MTFDGVYGLLDVCGRFQELALGHYVMLTLGLILSPQVSMTPTCSCTVCYSILHVRRNNVQFSASFLYPAAYILALPHTQISPDRKPEYLSVSPFLQALSSIRRLLLRSCMAVRRVWGVPKPRRQIQTNTTGGTQQQQQQQQISNDRPCLTAGTHKMHHNMRLHVLC